MFPYLNLFSVTFISLQRVSVKHIVITGLNLRHKCFTVCLYSKCHRIHPSYFLSFNNIRYGLQKDFQAILTLRQSALKKCEKELPPYAVRSGFPTYREIREQYIFYSSQCRCIFWKVTICGRRKYRLSALDDNTFCQYICVISVKALAGNLCNIQNRSVYSPCIMFNFKLCCLTNVCFPNEKKY